MDCSLDSGIDSDQKQPINVKYNDVITNLKMNENKIDNTDFKESVEVISLIYNTIL